MRADEIQPGMVLLVPAGADDIRKRAYKLKVRIVGRVSTSRRVTLFGWILKGEHDLTQAVMVSVNQELVQRLQEEEVD